MAELRPEVAEAVHTINCSRTSQQEVKAAWYLVHEELQRLTNKLDHLNTTNQAAIVDAQGNVRYYHARIWKKMNNDLEAAYATIKRLTDENARMRGIIETLGTLGMKQRARADKAEAELAALKARLFHGIILDVDDIARGHAGLPSEWRGKRVRLVVEK